MIDPPSVVIEVHATAAPEVEAALAAIKPRLREIVAEVLGPKLAGTTVDGIEVRDKDFRYEPQEGSQFSIFVETPWFQANSVELELEAALTQAFDNAGLKRVRLWAELVFLNNTKSTT